MEIKSCYSMANSGHADSLEEGRKYQDFICLELAKRNIIIQNFSSKYYQNKIGENLQRIEIKYDARCYGIATATNRLSIEVAEKTNICDEDWKVSGILSKNVGAEYIQGNYLCAWRFPTSWLQNIYKKGKHEKHDKDTIRTFYIPIEEADRYCIEKYVFNNNN